MHTFSIYTRYFIFTLSHKTSYLHDGKNRTKLLYQWNYYLIFRNKMYCRNIMWYRFDRKTKINKLKITENNIVSNDFKCCSVNIFIRAKPLKYLYNSSVFLRVIFYCCSDIHTRMYINFWNYCYSSTCPRMC